MKNLAGMVLGAVLDRRGGHSGAKGAVEGYLVEGGIKAIVPLALAFGAAWAIQHYARRGLGSLIAELDRQKAIRPEMLDS